MEAGHTGLLATALLESITVGPRLLPSSDSTIPMIFPFSQWIKIAGFHDHNPNNRIEEERKIDLLWNLYTSFVLTFHWPKLFIMWAFLATRKDGKYYLYFRQSNAKVKKPELLVLREKEN